MNLIKLNFPYVTGNTINLHWRCGKIDPNTENANSFKGFHNIYKQ